MECHADDVVVMELKEGLVVAFWVMHNAQCRGIVNHLPAPQCLQRPMGVVPSEAVNVFQDKIVFWLSRWQCSRREFVWRIGEWHRCDIFHGSNSWNALVDQRRDDRIPGRFGHLPLQNARISTATGEETAGFAIEADATHARQVCCETLETCIGCRRRETIQMDSS
eukprot:3209719-Rhodomonas_salina.1